MARLVAAIIAVRVVLLVYQVFFWRGGGGGGWSQAYLRLTYLGNDAKGFNQVYRELQGEAVELG